MTVSAPQRIAHTILSTSSAVEERHRRVADVGVDLHQEVAADDHRLGFRMIDVGGNDRATRGDLGAHELGRHVVGNRGAPGIAVACGGRGARRASEILADRDELHLGRDDAGTCVGELRYGGGALRAQRQGAHRELRGRVRTAGMAVIDRLHAPSGVGLGVAARGDPCGAQPRQPGMDVDGDLGIGVWAGGVVDRERRFAGRRLQRDLAHRDLQTRVQAAAHISLARGRQ